MSEERARILQMINQGKIDAAQGVELLNALRDAKPKTAPEPAVGKASWLRVRVSDLETGRTRVNVNVPISLVKAGIKLGARFAPETDEVDWDEVVAAIEGGAAGKLVDVEDIDDGEKVEIYVE